MNITVKEYLEGKAKGKKVYTETWQGKMEVTGISDNDNSIWIYCGKENMGMGRSFMAHYNTILKVE